MNRPTNGGTGSLLVKALAIEDKFFSLLDKLNEQTLTRVDTNIVELLHQYDRLLGFARYFTTGLDVRLICRLTY